MKPEKLLTPEEVAALLRCSPRTLRRMRRAKKIIGIQIGGGYGRWMYLPSEVARAEGKLDHPKKGGAQPSTKRDKAAAFSRNSAGGPGGASVSMETPARQERSDEDGVT